MKNVLVIHANISHEGLADRRKKSQVSERYDEQTGSHYHSWEMPEDAAQKYARQYAPSVRLEEVS